MKMEGHRDNKLSMCAETFCCRAASPHSHNKITIQQLFYFVLFQEVHQHLKTAEKWKKKMHKKTHPTVLALIFCLSTNFRFGERKSPVSGAGLDRITIKGERKQRARSPFPLADGMRKGSSSASSPCLFAPSSCQGGKVASRPGSPGPTFPFFLRVSADEKGTLGNCDKQAHQDKTGSAGNEAGAAAATGGDAPWFI